MREEFLTRFVCPDCESDFALQEVFNKFEGEIHDAIIGCECAKYPILDGILIYKKPQAHNGISNTASIISRMRIGRIKEAKGLPLKDKKFEKSLLDTHSLLTSLFEIKRPFNPILSMVQLRKKKMYEKFSGNLSFFDMMDILEPNTWGDYLKHRFSSQTFWSLFPIIPLVERKNNMILDLGCGAGHASFILSKHITQKNLVCTDENYTLLFMAKKFMAREANFICLDANNPLPFSDDVFSSIIMMDSFHYVSNRALLAKECQRIQKHDGLLLLLHLHNALQENISKGFPLAPKTWKRLFQNLNIKMIPENQLIEDFKLRFELNLAKEYDKAIINSSNALSMIGTIDEEVFRKYDNLGPYLENRIQNPIINPIYNLKRDGNKLLLKRNPPNDIFLVEYPLSERFLPERYSVPSAILDDINNKKIDKLRDSKRNNKSLRDMIRKFIIIDVPKAYV